MIQTDEVKRAEAAFNAEMASRRAGAGSSNDPMPTVRESLGVVQEDMDLQAALAQSTMPTVRRRSSNASVSSFLGDPKRVRYGRDPDSELSEGELSDST